MVDRIEQTFLMNTHISKLAWLFLFLILIYLRYAEFVRIYRAQSHEVWEALEHPFVQLT